MSPRTLNRLAVCLAIGLLVVGMALLAVSASHSDWDPIAGTMVGVAVLLLCWQAAMAAISRTARRSADAYQEGHDAGFDKGWREARKKHGALRVVRLRKDDDDAVDGTAS